MKLIHTAAAFLTFAFLSSTAYPVPIYSLVDYGFNIDGELSFASDPTPADVDISGFDTGTGLGTITATISGAGAHLFLFFEDIDIDTATNGSFNELGVAYGSPGAGQSWEIDEPDFDTGDILSHFSSTVSGSLLDNAVGLADFLETEFPNNIAWATGWNFNLDAGEIAEITLAVSTTDPGGFRLRQSDPETDPTSVFLSGALRIDLDTEPAEQVADGGSMAWMLCAAFCGLIACRRRSPAPSS